MTPEVVIYRYLEVLQREPVDVAALVRLICTDADLLGRWLTIPQAPADPEILREHLARDASRPFGSSGARPGLVYGPSLWYGATGP